MFWYLVSFTNSVSVSLNKRIFYWLAVRSIAVRSRSGMLSRDSRAQSVKMRISRLSQASIAFLISGVNLPIFI